MVAEVILAANLTDDEGAAGLHAGLDDAASSIDTSVVVMVWPAARRASMARLKLASGSGASRRAQRVGVAGREGADDHLVGRARAGEEVLRVEARDRSRRWRRGRVRPARRARRRRASGRPAAARVGAHVDDRRAAVGGARRLHRRALVAGARPQHRPKPPGDEDRHDGEHDQGRVNGHGSRSASTNAGF